MLNTLQGIFNLPLECKIQEDKEHSCCVASSIGRAAIFCDAPNQSRCCDEAAEESDHKHPSSRVDLVMEPGAERVVDDAGSGQP